MANTPTPRPTPRPTPQPTPAPAQVTGISAETLRAQQSQQHVTVPDRVVNEAMNAGVSTANNDGYINTSEPAEALRVDLNNNKLLAPGEKPSPYSSGTPNVQSLPVGTVLK